MPSARSPPLSPWPFLSMARKPRAGSTATDNSCWSPASLKCLAAGRRAGRRVLRKLVSPGYRNHSSATMQSTVDEKTVAAPTTSSGIVDAEPAFRTIDRALTMITWVAIWKPGKSWRPIPYGSLELAPGGQASDTAYMITDSPGRVPNDTVEVTRRPAPRRCVGDWWG